MYISSFIEEDWNAISKKRQAYHGIPVLSEEGVYEVFIKPDKNRPGYFVVTVYKGKSLKPYSNYTYANMQRAGEAVDKIINQIKEYKAIQDKRKQANKMRTKLTFEKIQIGDILNTSWGYDQTNVDFYQVIEKRGTNSVVLRKVASERVPSIYDTFQSGMVKPVKDEFIGLPFIARTTPHGARAEGYLATPYTGGDKGTYVSWDR